MQTSSPTRSSTQRIARKGVGRDPASSRSKVQLTPSPQETPDRQGDVTKPQCSSVPPWVEPTLASSQSLRRTSNVPTRGTLSRPGGCVLGVREGARRALCCLVGCLRLCRDLPPKLCIGPAADVGVHLAFACRVTSGVMLKLCAIPHSTPRHRFSGTSSAQQLQA